MATKLEKLLQKEEQIKAQIQQAKAAERTLEKKRDTRRKILIGAAVMARVNNGEWPKADLEMMMDGFLTRPHERELFDLDVLAEEDGSGDTASDGSGASAKVARADKVADKLTGGDEQKAVGEFSTARKKATKENLRKQREKEATKETAGVKKSGSSGAGLTEPDFDIDKEFNL